jgi:hypothetical protein
MKIETTTEIITPEKARQYLERNHCNRNVSPHHMQKMSRAMSAGMFFHTHQGIAFDTNGNLIDGQHRLAAIIDSDTTQTMQVTRNIPVASRAMVDNQSRPRSAHDSLIMEGHSLASKDTVAICRMWMFLTGERSPAVHEIREFLNKHEVEIYFATTVAAGNQILKHACVSTMMAVAFGAGHGEDIKDWADVIKTGIVTEKWQTSALKFRDWWMTTSHGGGSGKRVEYCQRIYTSMAAWVERRGLEKLYARQNIEWIN